MSAWDEPYMQSPLKIGLTVLIIVVFIVVIVVVVKMQQAKANNEPMLIENPVSPVNHGSISGSKAPLSSSGLEYTYNMWVNIRDWDQGYGKFKCIVHRSSKDPLAGPESAKAPSNPSIWLYPEENKLYVRVSTLLNASVDRMDRSVYPEYDIAASGGKKYTVVNPYYYANNKQSTLTKDEYQNTTYACDVANIPLQRWVQISVVMWNRTLDVYVNGKLVRSCILPGVPLHKSSLMNKIYVGGRRQNTFNGYISRLKYFNRACTAEEIYNMYLKGPLSAAFWWEALKIRAKLTLDMDA